jgi:hypothetical protein
MLPEAGNDGLYGALVRAFLRCPRRAPPYPHGVTCRSGMIPLTPTCPILLQIGSATNSSVALLFDGSLKGNGMGV